MIQTQEQTNVEFEKLLARPPFYFKTSPERQWEIDKDLGILDVQIDQKNITSEMLDRWKEYFK